MGSIIDQTCNITVVLADDHGIVCDAIAALCSSHGMGILERCSDGTTAHEAILRLKPDFAILDVQMPGMSGIEVVRSLHVALCSTKLIILSISRDASTVLGALRAGADAYLLKEGPSRHLLDAISFIREGGVYVSPLLRGAGLFTRAETGIENPLALLSPREVEVFSCLVNGLRTRDIAERLEISPKTVGTYRAGLMRKLQIHDLAGLVKYAIERDLTNILGCSCT